MEVQGLFINLIERGKLSHAYILWGQGGQVERARVAEAVAEMLEQRPFVDCLIISPLDGTIGIDTVREASRFVRQSPVRSFRKTLIVHEAQALTSEAQNAFLKIIEEPPAHGLILFTMRDPGLLVPALQSRMQKIFLPARFKIQDSRFKNNERVEKFLAASAKERKDIIKELLDQDAAQFEDFITGLMAELANNTLKNHRALAELSRRWMFMNQFQTNRKLQLEAVIALL